MKGESMSDPNNVPLPQQPEANGTPAPNPVPQYGAPAPAQPSQPAQPAYGQPAYGQPAPTANSYGQAAPTYGQPAPDANTYGQSAPAYGTPTPDGNPYGPVPPSYGQYAAPTATVPLDKPYYGCSFQEAFLRFWKKYVVFRGRASRSEFWWWVLAAFGINIVLDILNTATDEKLGFLATIWGLATLIPTLALSVRRLHDTNKPGWWVAIFYIAMVIGLIIMIIGGGAALYGGFRSLGSYDYGYGSMAAGGLGAAVIGALITLAGCVVYIVFMALPSKPEGARFDDGAAATPCLRVLTAHHTARLYPRISPLRTRPHPASTSRPRLTASRPCQPPTMASRLHPHLITVRCRPRSTANRRPRPHSTARFRRCLKTPATNPQHLLSTRLPPATMPRNPGKASNRYR